MADLKPIRLLGHARGMMLRRDASFIDTRVTTKHLAEGIAVDYAADDEVADTGFSMRARDSTTRTSSCESNWKTLPRPAEAASLDRHHGDSQFVVDLRRSYSLAAAPCTTFYMPPDDTDRQVYALVHEMN
jgi:hypothetical protein